jgi:glycosyltransferase involved in cell wall biosynthesis
MKTNKHILYISYDGMTDPLGQSQVIPYLEQISKQGYRFTILSVEKKKRMIQSGQVIARMLKDLDIEWSTLPFSSRPPLLSKLIDQKRLNARAALLHKQEKFDLIHCRSYVAAAAGLKLHHNTGVPFLFDMRGFWVDERVDSGHWKLQNPIYRILYKSYKRKERRYFQESAHIISLTQKGKDELIDHYQVPSSKITVIPCCVDLSLFDFHRIDSTEKQKQRAQLGIDNGSPVISYLGSLGGWYMTDEMLDFFSVMKRRIKNAKFLFISHNDRDALLQKASAKGIATSDILIQPASRQSVPLYLSISDWNIFLIKDVYSKKASSPTKQGEVMAMGIPLICNDIGDTGSIVKESGAGFLIKEFTEKEYDRVAVLMEKGNAADPEKIRLAAGKYYDLATGIQRYLDVYQQVIT